MTAKPSALAAGLRAAPTAPENGDPAPQGGVIGRFALYRSVLEAGVVVLVPVLH